jgi:hypothetical protein
MSSKLFIKGKQITVAVANALRINCKDKDGNKSTVQAELNKLNNEVSEQNKKFTEPELIVPTVSSSKLTITDGGYYKIGNIVILTLRLNVNTEIEANSEILLTDLPSYNSSTNYVSIQNNKNAEVTLSSGGKVITATNVSTGTWILNATYVCM